MREHDKSLITLELRKISSYTARDSDRNFVRAAVIMVTDSHIGMVAKCYAEPYYFLSGGESTDGSTAVPVRDKARHKSDAASRSDAGGARDDGDAASAVPTHSVAGETSERRKQKGGGSSSSSARDAASTAEAPGANSAHSETMVVRGRRKDATASGDTGIAAATCASSATDTSTKQKVMGKKSIAETSSEGAGALARGQLTEQSLVQGVDISPEIIMKLCGAWLQEPDLFQDITTNEKDIKRFYEDPQFLTLPPMARTVLLEQSHRSFEFCLSLLLRKVAPSSLPIKSQSIIGGHKTLVESCNEAGGEPPEFLLRYARSQILDLFGHSEQAFLQLSPLQALAIKALHKDKKILSFIVMMVTMRDMCRNCHRTMLLGPSHFLLQRALLFPPSILTTVDTRVLPIQYIVGGVVAHTRHVTLLSALGGAKVCSSRDPAFRVMVSEPVGLPSVEKLAVIQLPIDER